MRYPQHWLLNNCYKHNPYTYSKFQKNSLKYKILPLSRK